MLLQSLLIFCVIYIDKIGFINADDSQCIVNGKKAVNTVDERFISVTIDPAILLSGISISDATMNLGKHLQPSYIRLAGPSTSYLDFNEDVSKATNYITEDTDTITFSPQMWWSLNEWILKSNFTPIYALNDQERTKGNWNPKTIISLFELTAAMNVNCFWQLGYDCSLKTPESYRDDLIILRHLLDAFPEKKNLWKIVASDLSRCIETDHSDNLRNFIEDLDVDALMWEPLNSKEENYPENDLMRSVLTRYTATKMPIWSTAPKNTQPVSFESGLLWAKQIGEAAKTGYSVIFRQPRTHELFSDTPAYWVSVLHKHLMGTNVLDVKTTTILPTDAKIYAHCSKNQNSYTIRGAMTIMFVNNGNHEHKTSMRVAGTQMKNVEVRSYILTSSANSSTETLLNDEPLTMDLLNEDKLTFTPKLRRAKATTHLILSLPPKSIGFFVLPGARIPVCVDLEDETNLILEEMNQAQKIDFPDNKSTELFSRFTPKTRFNSLSDLYRKLEQEMNEDEKVYKKVKTNTFFRKNDLKQDNILGNKRMDLVKNDNKLLDNIVQDVKDNNNKLINLVKDATKDNKLNAFNNNNNNGNKLLDLVKDRNELFTGNNKLLDLVKDATSDLLEETRNKLDNVKDAHADLIEGKSNLFDRNKQGIFFDKVKDSELFNVKNNPSLLGMVKDMNLQNKNSKPTFMEKVKDGELFNLNNNPSLLGMVKDMNKNNKATFMEKVKDGDLFNMNNPSLLGINLPNKNSKPTFMEKVKDGELFNLNKNQPGLFDIDIQSKNSKPNFFEKLREPEVQNKYEKPRLFDLGRDNKLQKIEDEKNTMVDDVRKFFKESTDVKLPEIKKIDFKNLLKKEEIKEKPKLDLDLSSDEVLKILTERAKTKAEKKGIGSDIEGLLQKAFKNKIRSKRTTIRKKRDINMDLLNLKTGDKKINFKDTFKIKSRIPSLEATIRRPGQTSEEFIINIEKPKPIAPTKIYAGFAKPDEFSDELPDMKQIIPSFQTKESIFGPDFFTPKKESSLFHLPKDSIFNPKKEKSFSDYFYTQDNLFAPQKDLFGKKRENIFEKYQPKKSIFSLEPDEALSKFGLPSLELPKSLNKIKPTPAAPIKKQKTFIGYVKEDDDEGLDNLAELIDNDPYHGFFEKFGDNVKVMPVASKYSNGLEFGEFDDFVDFGDHKNGDLLGKELVLENTNDDKEVQKYVKDLETYFNNFDTESEKVKESETSWDELDDTIGDNDEVDRFKRDISKEYTEEDIRFYTKLMLENIVNMRKSMLERRRRSDKEKLLNLHENTVGETIMPRNLFMRVNLDPAGLSKKINAGDIMGKPYEHQIKFLKNRLAQRKKLDEAQESLGISKKFHYNDDLNRKFKEHFTHPNGIYGRFIRSVQNREKYDQVYIPKVTLANDLNKRYESKLKKIKEWQPEDLLKLPKLNKSHFIDNIYGGADSEKDMPIVKAGLSRKTNRIARNVDGDVHSAENTIDGFLNEIEKDTSFIKPLFDRDSGEYSIVFPSKDSIALIQKQGDTEIKIHQEKQLEDATCALTTNTDTNTESMINESTNIDTTEADVSEIITINDDLETSTLISDDDVENVKLIIQSKTHEHVQKIHDKKVVNGHQIIEKVFKSINGFVAKLHNKINSFFHAA